jgi:integrase
MITAHIIPGLGVGPLQKLDGKAIDRFYAHLRKDGRRYGGGVSAVTLHNIHRMLAQLLKSVKAKLIARSPIDDVQTKVTAKRRKVQVLDEAELVQLLAHLKGHWLYMPTLLAAYTGLRRGEVLGLRWRDIDMASATLQVTQSVEIVSNKLVLIEPKTDRSRRTVTLPDSLLRELARHKKEQAAMRLKLGLGKDAADLVFTSPEGEMLNPDVLSEMFRLKVRAAGIKCTKFHGLRHFHITHLLKSGVPVHVVSARAGHARASITLDAYSHLIGGEDAAAAKAAEESLRRALK